MAEGRRVGTLAVSWLFDTAEFTPRWICGNWPAALGWMHIVADAAVFGAYFAIPLSLLYFVRRRRDVPLRGIFFLFMAFILLCGLTHLVEASLFWYPMYRFSGVMKAATAVISWATVVALVRVAPAALALPRLASDHARLSKELEEGRRKTGALSAARSQLEERSGALTQRDRRLRDALGGAGAFACRWRAATGEIEWQVDAERCLSGMLPAGSFSEWADAVGREGAERLREASVRAGETGRPVAMDLTLAPPGRGVIHVEAAPDRVVAGLPVTLTGLVVVRPGGDSGVFSWGPGVRAQGSGEKDAEEGIGAGRQA